MKPFEIGFFHSALCFEICPSYSMYQQFWFFVFVFVLPSSISLYGYTTVYWSIEGQFFPVFSVMNKVAINIHI